MWIGLPYPPSINDTNIMILPSMLASKLLCDNHLCVAIALAILKKFATILVRMKPKIVPPNKKYVGMETTAMTAKITTFIETAST